MEKQREYIRSIYSEDNFQVRIFNSGFSSGWIIGDMIYNWAEDLNVVIYDALVDMIPFYTVDELQKKVIKFTKTEFKRIELNRYMNHRDMVNDLIDFVDMRMKGFRPQRCGKVMKWIK